MSASDSAVADDGTRTSSLLPDSLLDVIGTYRWTGAFVGVELGLFVIAVVLDSVLGAPVMGGLTAAVAVVIAAFGVLTFAGLLVYRTLSDHT